MSSRFDPEYYARYRPFYPPETFAGIDSRLLERGLQPPFKIADIGCGTGHSLYSWIEFAKQRRLSAEMIGIDPDSKMLDQARILLRPFSEVTLRCALGEETGLESKSIDAVLVGSAFHWMDIERASMEFERILKPSGIVRIFEYQFPKSGDLPALNEWIKREFNTRWKAPRQKPRGSLKELSAALVQHAGFGFLGEAQPSMRHRLNTDELAGLLLSQSRVLHYEDTLSQSEKTAFRDSVRSKIAEFLGDQSPVFDFKLAWFEFGL